MLPPTSFRSLALMLRGRARLTQRHLAGSLGVSERAVQIWEAGLGYPSAASLQRLIELYVNRAAFTVGNEVEEACALWSAAAAEAPRLKAAFDREWFVNLLDGAADGAVATNGQRWARKSRPRVDWGE